MKTFVALLTVGSRSLPRPVARPTASRFLATLLRALSVAAA